MKDLICLFWRNYSSFKIAIAKEDLDTITKLDIELNSAIGEIINRPARDLTDVAHQFRFATDLINVEAEDVGCVKRNIGLIRKLVEKYVGLGIASDTGDPAMREPGSLPFSVLDEDHYDDHPAPVVVFKTDYTVSYANPKFCELVERAFPDVLGRHAADLFGLTRFRNDLQMRIDECLDGAISRYTFADTVDGETWVKIFEFSPCYSPSQSFVGALIRLTVVPDRRAGRAN